MAGVTYKTFNTLLSEFVSNLSETFDDVQELQTACLTLDGMVQLNADIPVPLDTFHEMFSGHSDLIMNKDDSLFKHVSLPFVKEFDMKSAYAESDEETREAIWGYLQQLLFMSTSVKTMTPEMFSTIEKVTEAYMQKVRDGTISEEQANNPLFIMQEIQQNADIMKAIGESGL